MKTPELWVEMVPSKNRWRAVFAYQICLQPFSELIKLKWGMNTAFLLGEALDRQKLFLESQFHGDPLGEAPADERTLTFRVTNLPGQGLLLTLMGQKSALTPELARQMAVEYAHELLSIFPTDYKLYPAETSATFALLSGQQILSDCRSPQAIQQILRFETPVRTKNGLIYLNGFWQTADHSDEQIWRALGNFPHPVILNITIKPARLENDERQVLWDMEQVSQPSASISPAHPSQPFDKWAEALINRRLSPWKRFYQLQVHLLAPLNVPHWLTRAIGSAFTRETSDLLSPGFRARPPADTAEASAWVESLAALEPTQARINPSSVARLSDLSDLTEAASVFRFPYPPEAGLPGVKFLEKQDCP